MRPYLSDKEIANQLQPVLDDLDTRYFDGVRLKSQADAKETVNHLEPLLELLEDEAEDRQPFADALVATLTGVRLLADASIQDAEAIVNPWKIIVPAPTAPAGLSQAQDDLTKAKKALKDADEQLREADPEDATEANAEAWKHGFTALSRFGITYEGDHDTDGVVSL